MMFELENVLWCYANTQMTDFPIEWKSIPFCTRQTNIKSQSRRYLEGEIVEIQLCETFFLDFSNKDNVYEYRECT